jgi:hypothetical protein
MSTLSARVEPVSKQAMFFKYVTVVEFHLCVRGLNPASERQKSARRVSLSRNMATALHVCEFREIGASRRTVRGHGA